MKLYKNIIIITTYFSLNSCGPLAYKKTDARKFPQIQMKE